MGCWNQTCALTRLPIRAGEPVVAFHTVRGPRYNSESDSSRALTFGLPFSGKYDDHGGVEELERPDAVAFQQTAFETAGYYKKHVLRTSYGSEFSWLLASDPDALWPLAHDIKSVFYPEMGVDLPQSQSDDEASRTLTLQAFQRAQAALKALGTRLGQEVFEGAHPDAQRKLFGIIEEFFGKPCAWHAWSVLSTGGLFATRGQFMVHKSAFEEIVRDFGSRKVQVPEGSHLPRGPKKQPVREYLQSTFRTWVETLRDKQARLDQAYAARTDVSDVERKWDVRDMLQAASSKAKILMPTTRLWMGPEIPLIGHFWGGTSLQGILDAFEEEQLLDYFVFQWASHYLRVDLREPGHRTQNGETTLLEKAFKGAMSSVRKAGHAGRDFEGRSY